MTHPQWLVAFANESNKIEGMAPARTHEMDALAAFLALDTITIDALQSYVSIVAPGHQLRERSGLNVRVGSHIAPAGGPVIRTRLEELLAFLPRSSPYHNHIAYETLHPFTDGNGRSGRALWLWQHLNFDQGDRVKTLGFLHSFYYEALQFSRQPGAEAGGGQ